MKSLSVDSVHWQALHGIQKELADLADIIQDSLDNCSAADFLHDGYYFKNRIATLAEKMDGHMSLGALESSPTFAGVNARRGT